MQLAGVAMRLIASPVTDVKTMEAIEVSTLIA
jgi:hypothetical protein